MAENGNVTAKTTAGVCEGLADRVRIKVEDLAFAAVLYDREFRQFAAWRAGDWAITKRGNSPLGNNGDARTALAGSAELVKETLYGLVAVIESEFAAQDVFAPPADIDPDLLLCILSERAICSELFSRSGIMPQGQEAISSDAWIEASALPSAAEIDTIIAHGVKLTRLLANAEPFREKEIEHE